MTRKVSAVVAIAAALAWVPFVTRPLGPDEGGFLLVASQWRPGGSLYGHYWVDRPPLLISIFDIASHLGGAIGLRAIGIACVVVSVLLADLLGRLGRATDEKRRGLAPALVAAVFLSTPLFGATAVNGELLAVPLVLAGICALVHGWARGPRGPRAFGWAVLAGVAAAGAALVKQNVVDVFVVAAALVVLAATQRAWRRAAHLGAGVLVGSASAAGACLVLAEARGTEPLHLWDAVVLFRGQAAAVIHSSSTSSTSGRLVELLGAALLSGAPLVLAVLVLRVLRSRRPVPASATPDLRVPALALLLWELFGVLAGGSYWLHYLIGLVPGLVLLAAAAGQREPALRRWTAAVLGYAIVSASVATVTAAVITPTYSSDAAVAAYIRDRSSARDSVVVGFGHPNIVYDTGLHSPYEQLWSLPVRVRDPRLHELTGVLESPRAPTWVVVNGTSLATWGVDATSAQQVLEERYHPATSIGDYVVWRLGRADA